MPRSPDELAQALDAAAELFRKEGYERTSIEDVVQHTGMNRYTLYRAFGAKRDLYLAALDRFHRAMMADLQERLAAPGYSPLAALYAHFRVPLEDLSCDAQAPGSLLCQAAFEVAPQDAEVKARLDKYMVEKAAAIAATLARARGAGELRAGIEPGAGAALLMTTMFGLAAQIHAGFAGADVMTGLDAAFAAIAADPTAPARFGAAQLPPVSP